VKLALALTLAGCAIGAEVQRDIEYAVQGGVSLKLDAYVPDGRGPFPLAIVVHGGGWTAGDKAIEWVQPLFRPLQEAGFAWVSINYRLTGQAPYPAMIEDTYEAIRWVRKNAGRLKADPKRLALIGESAGGHIVANVGARGRGETSVAAVVDFYGPHDLNRQVADRDNGDPARIAKQLLNAPPGPKIEQTLREASPIEYVHRRMPPFLFIHGTADTSVPVNQSPLMCDKMKAAGARCEVFIMDGAPHGMSGWEKTPAFHAYKPRMIAWLKQTLRVR
jgi:alpha-L-fucosidase 2